MGVGGSDRYLYLEQIFPLCQDIILHCFIGIRED
jgi:hypothetical protein